MDIANIEISKLYVSNINVTKTLTSEEDEIVNLIKLKTDGNITVNF